MNCQQPFPDDDPFLPRNYGADEYRKLQQEDDDDDLLADERRPLLWWVGLGVVCVMGWWGITAAVLAAVGGP